MARVWSGPDIGHSHWRRASRPSLASGFLKWIVLVRRLPPKLPANVSETLTCLPPEAQEPRMTERGTPASKITGGETLRPRVTGTRKRRAPSPLPSRTHCHGLTTVSPTPTRPLARSLGSLLRIAVFASGLPSSPWVRA